MEIIKLSKKIIKEAVKVINNGGVIVFPTDTVYGLICDATNKKAVEKIFKIKKREKDKVLPIFINSIKKARKVAEINKKQEEILKKYWPGKYTFVLKSKIQNPKSELSKLVIGKDNTIGIRIPNYKELNDLLKKIDKPLAQTSANISSFEATTKIEEVINYFKDKKNKPDLIIGTGNLPERRPSVIIDLTKEKIKILRK